MLHRPSCYNKVYCWLHDIFSILTYVDKKKYDLSIWEKEGKGCTVDFFYI